MDSDNFISGFWAGFVTAGFIFILLVAIFWGEDKLLINAKREIAQCEATLPRNQHCKITAEVEK